MGISFLAPLFLVGLAALAIPVLVHLTHRVRRDAVPFPSLLFLQKIPYRTVRRQKIRHWMLLLVRAAAIVLLVAAFARPLLDRPTASAAAVRSARELVVLLDRSFSMGYGDRWDRALAEARGAVSRMGPDDRATLVFFAEDAATATPATGDRAVLNAALDTVRPGSAGTRYGPALRLARRILEGSDRPAHEVVLITDFQRVGWEGAGDVRLPDDARLIPVDLSDPEPSNLAVTGVRLGRVETTGRGAVAVTSRVANQGGAARSEVGVELLLAGSVVSEQTISIEPNSAITVNFPPQELPPGTVRGMVRVTGDALDTDNAFRFIVPPGQTVRVLLLEGTGTSVYLRRALDIGQRPQFDVDRRRLAALRESDLTDRTVAIVDDAPVDRNAARALTAFLERGGGVLLVLGRHSRPQSWGPEAASLLPVPFGQPVDRSDGRGATLSYLDYDHPVFELFRAPRSGDFASARFFRYRRAATTAAPDAVLARFDDGGSALVEGRHGDGRALVWSSGLDNFWSDFVLQPVFLPFLHQAVKYLADYHEPAPAYTVGDVVELTRQLELLPSNPELVVESPGGRRTALELTDDRPLLPVERHGFYELRVVGGDPVAALAVNVDHAESNLAPVAPDELVAAASASPERDPEPAGGITPAERERRQGLWWFLLVGATLLLVSETVISNRLSRHRGRVAQKG